MSRRKNSLVIVRGLAGAFFVACVVIGSNGCGGGNKETKRITGGGSSFVNPIMQKWSDSFRESNGTEIEYKSSGSGDGIKQMIARTQDFGCTDVPMSEQQTKDAQKEGGNVIHVPVAMGAVAIIYNVPGITEQLVLDGKTLADIYRMAITFWNDPEIAKLNPKLRDKLPNERIILVFRSEASGTTKIFTEFLAKSSPEFKQEIPPSSEPKWKQGGTGQNGNAGIAGFVKNNPGTIGYVELYYAKDGFTFAKLRNRKGVELGPDQVGVVAAAAESAMNTPPKELPYTLHELTFSMTDIDNEKAYPICGLTYAVFYAKQPQNKGKKIVEFLKWAVSDGQKFAENLGYAPLPDALATKAKERLGQVEFQ